MNVTRVTKRAVRDIASDTVRSIIILRGWSLRDLARRAGLNYQVTKNVLSGGNQSWNPRAAINRALRQQIFARPSNIKNRNRKL